MRITFADLWRPTGTVDRGTYALVGLIGFAIKHNLDRIIASKLFHHRWDLFNYWEPIRNAGGITHLSARDAHMLTVLVVTALPFIWVGVVMTIKRLRDADAPLAYVILFFVPFLNLLFFVILSLIPTCKTVPRSIAAEQSWLARVVPDNPFGSAALAVLLTGIVGLGAAVFSVLYLVRYGWGLFVALPFAMGFAAACIHGIRRPRSLPACTGVAALSIGLLGCALLAFAIEGVFCLIMAIPLALPLAVIGGICGYLVQKRAPIGTSAPAYLGALLLVVPSVQWVEHVIAPAPQTFVVRSSIEINASPQQVWKQVIAFTEIGPPHEWMFRAGIAYPIRAEIFGSGPGAERRCVFSTGAFIEPIEIWDEPHRLKFSVTSNPAPMQEWTPYNHVDPPHLHGFLVSNGGQFLLTPLPNGHTRLEGTTWYRHGLWPAQYWRLWSDELIHRIHMRVLTHIRDEAERRGSS